VVSFVLSCVVIQEAGRATLAGICQGMAEATLAGIVPHVGRIAREDACSGTV